MPNNVIEIVLRAKDQASGTLKGVTSSLGGLKAFLGSAGVAFALKKIFDNSTEAQEAVAQLGVAFTNSAEAARRSQQEILDFSAAAQKASTFSDEAVTRSQTTLLRFGRVSGDVFDRARKSILDVSSALRIDLESSANIVGRALEAPAQGMRQLRQLQILFTDSQRELIRHFEETGQTEKAQAIILDALESKYENAAAAARNTLGGALEALKNAFGDLFETTAKDSQGAVSGINALTEAVSSDILKGAVSNLLGSLGSVLRVVVKIGETAVSAFKKMAEEMASAADQIDKTLTDKLGAVWIGAKKGVKLGAAAALSPIPGIGPLIFNDAIGEATRNKRLYPRAGTSASRQGSGLKFIPQSELDRIADEEAQRRKAAQEALDKSLGLQESRDFGALERQRNARSLIHPLPVIDEQSLTQTQEDVDRAQQAIVKSMDGAMDSIEGSINEAMKKSTASVDNFVDSFKLAFQDVINTGHFSIKSFVRSFIAELSRKAIFNAIDRIGKAMTSALSGSGGGGSSGSSFWGSVVSGIGMLFGFAGGGRARGLGIAGEEGPELINFGAGAQVWNSRQLAFAGAGGGIHFAPQTNIVIEAREGDANTLRQEFSAALALTTAKQDRHFQRVLQENGLGRVR